MTERKRMSVDELRKEQDHFANYTEFSRCGPTRQEVALHDAMSHLDEVREENKCYVESFDDNAEIVEELSKRAEKAEALNTNLEALREHLLIQAQVWSGEAKTQRSTVHKIGSILGGVPCWGPIVKGVEKLVADKEKAEARVTELEAEVAELDAELESRADEAKEDY